MRREHIGQSHEGLKGHVGEDSDLGLPVSGVIMSYLQTLRRRLARTSIHVDRGGDQLT